MPLSPPAQRTPLHIRQIICEGFQRADGLWDIEGRLIDTKTYEFPNQDRGGTLLPGEAAHHMLVRVTIDDGLLIVGAEVVMDSTPFAICSAIAPDFSALAGMRMGPGFRKALTEKFGGTRGCTHVIELMGPIATTAFQTLAFKAKKLMGDRRPPMIDRCHAMAADGPVVARQWPQWSMAKTPAAGES